MKNIIMETNKENTTTIYVTREHDKICLLEKIIKYVTNNINTELTINLETIISNLIDAFALKDEDKINIYLNILTKTIDEQEILNIIIELSIAISIQKPYALTIEVNNQTNKYIKYINNNYILPLF
jgi:hypothetical protein